VEFLSAYVSWTAGWCFGFSLLESEGIATIMVSFEIWKEMLCLVGWHCLVGTTGELTTRECMWCPLCGVLIGGVSSFF
jgi:hypothetical protein